MSLTYEPSSETGSQASARPMWCLCCGPMATNADPCIPMLTPHWSETGSQDSARQMWCLCRSRGCMARTSRPPSTPRSMPPVSPRFLPPWGNRSPPPDILGVGCRSGNVLVKRGPHSQRESEFFIDNLLVRIHFIIVMIRWTGLAPWEFEFPVPGSLTSTFLTPTHPLSTNSNSQ